VFVCGGGGGGPLFGTHYLFAVGSLSILVLQLQSESNSRKRDMSSRNAVVESCQVQEGAVQRRAAKVDCFVSAAPETSLIISVGHSMQDRISAGQAINVVFGQC
jgi:hypothetical protein